MQNDKSGLTSMEKELAKFDNLTRDRLQKYKVIFIKLESYREDLAPQELYDFTRWCWIVNVERANRCEYVFAVYQRRIVAIYANPVWEKVTSDNCVQAAPKYCQDPLEYVGTRGFFVCDDYRRFVNSPLIDKPLDDDNFGAKGARNPIKYNYEM